MTIRCPQCSEPWREGNQFCVGCGAQAPPPPVKAPQQAQSIYCRKCGASTETGKPFCPSCGAAQGDTSLAKSSKAKPVKAAAKTKIEKSIHVVETLAPEAAANADIDVSLPTIRIEKNEEQIEEEISIAPLASEVEVTPDHPETCPSCNAAWRQGGKFCPKCGYAQAAAVVEHDQLVSAELYDSHDPMGEKIDGDGYYVDTDNVGYAATSASPPWPLFAAIIAIALLIGIFFIYKNQDGQNEASTAGAETPAIADAAAPQANQPADEANAAVEASSLSATQQTRVSGIYMGNLVGQRVFLSLNGDVPREMAVATGSARYLQGNDLLCDTVIASASPNAEGTVALEQRPSGNGKACPKNFRIILDLPADASFSNGSTDRIKATWLDPDTGSIMGSSILQR
jgi:Double zinc ribbon